VSAGPDRRAPLAITGAGGQVGTLLTQELERRGVGVVPLARGDDWEEAIAGADAVAHLAGTLQPRGGNSYRAANVTTSERVASAAREARVRRVVFLSYVGADPGSANGYLASKGRAEQVLLASGVEVTILRCLHIFGPPERPGPTATAFIADRRGRVRVLGPGSQLIAPLMIGDVVAATIRALLDPDAPSGVLELGGPETMTVDELVELLNRGPVRVSHLSGFAARLLGRLLPALTPALVDLLLRDNVVPNAREEALRLGVELHPLEQAWAQQRST
jgi:uncharacterized protein YbjT (DUF2867 family)